jgi:hypothetical protein
MEIEEIYKRRRSCQIIKKEKAAKKDIFESITGCKHPLIASGLLPSRALVVHPTKLIQRTMKLG